MKRRSFISGLLSGVLLPFHNKIMAIEQSVSLNKTGFISDRIFLQHHISAEHPESPDRIKYINRAMKNSGLLEQLLPVTIKEDIVKWIKTVHTDKHIASISKNVPVTHRVAMAGVGACLDAVDQVVSRKMDNAFCATRPPGHHALNTGKEEGFCYYNNVAIAARYAQQHYDLKKVLIIDWDYHHGNATEAMFYDDPSVLFFSTHDLYAYPGTGDPSRKGEGAGLGYNINVHLPCGTGDQKIIDVFNKVLVPAADKFKPDMVLLSAGFDSRKNDLLGCYDITDTGFTELTRIVMSIANQYCEGRLVSILEGGYNLKGNADAVVTHVKTLMEYR